MAEQNKDKYEEILKAISEVRYYLGEEVFTVTESALDENSKRVIEIDEVYKRMSSLASEISAVVFESKIDKDLSESELITVNKISMMAPKLASLQYFLMGIKKKREEWQKIVEEIGSLGEEFGRKLMDLQNYTLDIVTSFRQMGYDDAK